MKSLLKEVENLKSSSINKTINKRMKEFEEAGKKPSNEIFKELCFCLLTANFNAEKSIKIQKEVNNGFLKLTEEEMVEQLKKHGHRYPNVRSKYILEARKHKDSIKKTLESFNSEEEKRDWVVSNVKGLGYKESSHFLRNIGYNNLAIIDFHIVDILVKHNLIEKPKTITKKVYLEIEELLRKIGNKSDLNMAELDLYLWFAETDKVLK